VRMTTKAARIAASAIKVLVFTSLLLLVQLQPSIG
jgi:hypothetical protein